MIIFLDTEFTELAMNCQLLSLGIVADASSNREFYAEVTDAARLAAASRFATSNVLPQFGKIHRAGCSYMELGVRVAEFLYELGQEFGRLEPIKVAFESYLDWELLERAGEDAAPARWEATRQYLLPVNVYNIPGFTAGARAAENYFNSQTRSRISRHHALCDARALRISYQASAASDLAARTRVAEPLEAAAPLYVPINEPGSTPAQQAGFLVLRPSSK